MVCGALSFYYMRSDPSCIKSVGLPVTISFALNIFALLSSLLLVSLSLFNCLTYENDYIMMGRIRYLRSLPTSQAIWILVMIIDFCMIAVFVTVLSATGRVM